MEDAPEPVHLAKPGDNDDDVHSFQRSLKFLTEVYKGNQPHTLAAILLINKIWVFL